MKLPSVLKRAARFWRRSKAPGRFIKRHYANAAGTRAYKVYLPARYGGKSLPLVVMLHGCKQTPDDFAVGTGMNRLADELDFIVVYPSQARIANFSRCWNWFSLHNQQRDQGEPSLIAGITREVIERYGVDERRVYVAGLSAGGAMAAVMGATYPELYAAVGVHSGLPYASARDAVSAIAAMRGQGEKAAPLPRVPTIVFHGDRDTTVHPHNGRYGVEEARLESEQGEVGGRSYTRTRFRGRPKLEHWLVHGGGHAWFGGNDKGSYADPAGPDAAREMLRFFAIA
ncbi:MAG TPA: PHB depolymerase family esterase [Burkholderiales bacterium]|nr:PHB depolymerase family esterase [Burkholderiales bacterium]